MEIVIGAVVGAAVAVVVLLVARRRRERIDPILGTPVPPTLMSPRDRPMGAPGPTPGAADPAGLDGLLGGLRSAMGDGELTDDEIRRLLPGAEVTRDGDDVTVVQQSTSTTTHVEVDGQVYESIDDVPDPVVREQLRRLLGD